MEILTKTGREKREIRLFGVYVEKIKKIMLRDLMTVLSTIEEVFNIILMVSSSRICTAIYKLEI